MASANEAVDSPTAGAAWDGERNDARAGALGSSWSHSSRDGKCQREEQKGMGAGHCGLVLIAC